MGRNFVVRSDGRNVGAPCNCFECHEAGVSDQPLIRVPGDHLVSVPHFIHGQELKRWYARRDAFLHETRAKLAQSRDARSRFGRVCDELATAHDVEPDRTLERSGSR